MTSPATVRWDGLPAPVRAAVEQHAGPVREAAPWGEGLNSPLRLVLSTASGKVFAKGAGPDDPDRRHWKLDAGAALAPYVETVAPALLWQVREAGWNIAGYRHVDGRPWADQEPGSPDIPKITAVLRHLAAIPAPPALTTTAADCWGQYADDPAALGGDALVHRDLNPANFVITDDRAWLVDWGWAVRGPAWLSPALLVLFLTESGWDIPAAEEAAAAVPGWDTAPPRAVSVFADANVRMWDEAVAAAPGWPRDFRAGCARRWADHRAGLTGSRM